MCSHALASSALAIFVGLALACGGGGSGSSGGGADAEITADNAEEIASDVLEAIFLSTDLSAFAGEIPDFYPNAAGGIAVSQVIGPTTESCPGGGTRTFSGDVAGAQPRPGDRRDTRFDDCVDPVGGPELNGRFAFLITGLTGNVDALFSIALALTLDAFSEETAGETQTFDGDATTFFNNTAPPLVLSSAEGMALRFTDSDRTIDLRNYQAILSQDLDESDYSIEADGRVSRPLPEGAPPPTPAYTGDVLYDTTQNLTADAGELPSEGVVDVLGANDSALRIVPVTGFNIDFGTALAPPPRDYAAASEQAGRWTNVGLDEIPLAALIGGDSPVRVKVSALSASGSVSSPTNDDQRLLNDQFSSETGAPWTVTVSGVTSGSYDVYLYAPTDAAVATGAMTVSGVGGVASIPGDASGSLVEGVSWVVIENVQLVTGQPLVITGTDAGVSGLAGLQIVPVETGVVNVEVDADGDGEFEQTIPSTWAELQP